VRIPNGDKAVVDIAKLRDYCLNVGHPMGKHKARVFASKLGVSARHAEWLQQQLLDRAKSSVEAAEIDSDRYGRRFQIDFILDGPKGRGTIRSSWIIRTAEEHPRLVTCYVL